MKLFQLKSRLNSTTTTDKNHSLTNFLQIINFETDIETEEWVDPYDSISLKLLTVFVYFVELMAAIVMFTFVAYEKGGYAGPYRTLINQLLSWLYGGVSLYSLVSH